ncbi:MAG: hypothetical protein NC432_02525 [Roseburia sp.]|nr:hypothetical protein [Roseburia sp.]MCM1097163.1 hypothetical protein [Ruminococcus flavefaciens]
MKRMSKALCALGIAVVLAGCGQADPAANLAQNITMSNEGSQADAAKDDRQDETKQEESGAPETPAENKKDEGGAFAFVYEGVSLVPGEIFDASLLGEAGAVSEVPSCAFDGNDRVYTYEQFELTAYIDGEQERIYSIYFIDPNLPTTEGLCIGDPLETMKSLYGEGFEMVGDAYDYTRGDTVLSVVPQGDTVFGIEYRLNR